MEVNKEKGETFDDKLFDLSDEEFERSSTPDTLFGGSSFNEDDSSTKEHEEDNEEDNDDGQEPEQNVFDDSIEDEEETDNSSDEDFDDTSNEDEEEDNEDLSEENDSDNSGDSDNEKNNEEKNTSGNDNVDKDIDYKAEYKRILAPFKANGEEIQVDNVDQAIKLMQKGANYNFKMTRLKPNLKILKMLENNNLLDESKLNFLIDLDKKDEKAILKLMKDSGIDPLDVNLEEEADYTPNSYDVKDHEIMFDNVIQDISTTNSYPKTIKIVGEQWDKESQKALYQNPQEIKIINDHVANGVYDQIAQNVSKFRALGELDNVSDYDAYRVVSLYMQKNNLFTGSANNSQPGNVIAEQIKNSNGVPNSGADTTQNSKLNKRKMAAGSTKSTPKKKKVMINPFDVADDEFDKIPKPNI